MQGQRHAQIVVEVEEMNRIRESGVVAGVIDDRGDKQ